MKTWSFLLVIFSSIYLICISQLLLTQLRTLFDLIVDFQVKQEAMFDAFLTEAKLRKQFDVMKRNRTEQVISVEREGRMREGEGGGERGRRGQNTDI